MTAYRFTAKPDNSTGAHEVLVRKRARQAVLQKAYQVRKENWLRYKKGRGAEEYST